MDSGSNLFEPVNRPLTVGALVRLRSYRFDHTVVYYYGVVMDEGLQDQLEIFPYVSVFIFNMGRLTRQHPSSLEVVSETDIPYEYK